MRPEKAKAEWAACRLPLTEIALKARFSSRASITRAFHRATGVTTKEYRRHRQQEEAHQSRLFADEAWHPLAEAGTNGFDEVAGPCTVDEGLELQGQMVTQSAGS